MLNLTFCFTWMLEETRDIQVRIFSKHLCRNNIECVLKSHPKIFLYILCRKRKKFTKLQKHNIQAGTWILSPRLHTIIATYKSHTRAEI